MSVETSNQPEYSEGINWPAITVIIIGAFMVFLDSSIVNVALPKMMAVFGVAADSAEWILTAYMLTIGVLMPLSGYLGDAFGYRRCCILSIALFVAGSVLCGLSWSINSMIAARVIQGVGGGIAMPLGMAIIYQECPRSKIGMVFGIWGIAAMAAPAIGPTLGGYLVDYLNWRMIFFINLPLGLFDLYLAAVNIRETRLIAGKSLDLAGMLLSSVGFFCLLLALSKGASKGWASPYIVSLLLAALVSLASFTVNELRHPEPIIELRLFRNLTFTIANIITMVINVVMFAVLFLMPILIQNVLGQSAMKSGLIVFPGAIASGLMMPLSGWIFDRYGPRAVSVIGLSLLAWASYAMRGFNDLTPFAVMTLWLVIRGFGLGLSTMPAITAAMNTVPEHLVGRASALTNVIRQISASFGIAIFTTIMQNRQAFHFANLARSVNMNSNCALALQAPLRALAVQLGLSYGTAEVLGLEFITMKIEQLSMISAIDDCFIVAAAVTLVALALCLLLRDKTMKA